MKNILEDTKKHIQRLSLIQEGDDSIFLCGKKLSAEEVAYMREVTYEIVASEELIQPLQKLIDRKRFMKLSEEIKMKYLLELSSIFIYLKKTMK